MLIIIFKRFCIAKNCLRTESAPLSIGIMHITASQLIIDLKRIDLSFILVSFVCKHLIKEERSYQILISVNILLIYVAHFPLSLLEKFENPILTIFLETNISGNMFEVIFPKRVSV